MADNAKNDSKAPTFLNGLFRGYLAFDTGQPFHYRVRASLDCWCVSAIKSSCYKTNGVSAVVLVVLT